MQFVFPSIVAAFLRKKNQKREPKEARLRIGECRAIDSGRGEAKHHIFHLGQSWELQPGRQKDDKDLLPLWDFRDPILPSTVSHLSKLEVTCHDNYPDEDVCRGIKTVPVSSYHNICLREEVCSLSAQAKSQGFIAPNSACDVRDKVAQTRFLRVHQIVVCYLCMIQPSRVLGS